MKLALVTIVTVNLEPMRTFYQAVLQIEPQIYRGNYVEFTLETGTLALWRQSECAGKRNKKVAVFVLCSLIRGTMEGAMHHGL
jgi:hypothetical protein